MKKLFYILLLLISVKTYGQQPAPFNPVQLNQNTMYYEPITGDRYGYNGAVYKWYRIPFVIAPNTVISGLTLSVSGNTLTVQPGYWRISNIIYHKATTTIFTLAARDSVYSRYETVYADSANNIGIAVGTLSPNPVEPSIPSGDLRVGAALITPTGTSTIQPGPITNYVFTNPLVKQFAFPWVYSLKADTIKTAHYIFPVNDGTSGQVIQTDGAGNLFWSNQAIYNAGFGLNLTANVFSVDTIAMVTQTALRDTLTAHTAHIGFGLLTSNDTLKVDTLVLPFIPFNFRSNVKVLQHGDTLSFNGPVIGTPLEGVYQSNPGARESSDFAVQGSGVNTSTNPKLLISDHSTVAYRAFMRGSTAANPLSGTDAAGLIIGDQDITAAAGGSYSMFNQLAIKPLHIINTGGATIDSAYTLNITGAPTGAGINGALKVKGGVTLLDLPPITGGTSLVVDAGGNVGTGSGGGGGSFLPLNLTHDTTVNGRGHKITLISPFGIGGSFISIDSLLGIKIRSPGTNVGAGLNIDSTDFQLFNNNNVTGREYAISSTGDEMDLSRYDLATNHFQGLFFGNDTLRVKDQIFQVGMVADSDYSAKIVLNNNAYTTTKAVRNLIAGSSLIDGSGTTAVGGNQANLGGTLTSNFNLNLNGNQVDFHNYNSFTSYDFLTADNPSPTIDSANYSHFAINNTGVDITVNKDISHQLFVYIDVATRVGFNSAFGISDDITHNGIEISHINHAAYTNNSLVNKSYADSTAKFKADSVKGTITGGVSSVSGTTNRVTSTGGATPVIDISASYLGQSSITTVGTLSAGIIPYSLLTGTPTVPTGANPTATIGFTAVNGASANFIRADGAPKADSTVIASTANHPTLAQLQTKINTLSGIYQPLEDQRLSTTNSPSFVKESLTGTAGNGYLDFGTQSASPASVTNHLRIYSDSLNRLSWKNSLYRRTIQVPYPSDYTIRMPYLVTGTTLEDSTYSRNTYVPLTRTVNGKALSSNITLGLASSDFANQGTTTTVYHGNASGNPSFGQIVNADITNSTIDLTAKVTGLLPDANISSATNWNTAYTNRITSLTTTGTSGAATLSGNVLNIPQYANTTYTNGRGITLTGTTFGLDTTQNYTWLKVQQDQINAIAATSTDGHIFANNTLATSGVANQWSPRARFHANVWNTTATAANNQVDVIEEVQTTSGASPTYKMVWSGRLSTAGTGAYTPVMSIDNGGAMVIPGAITTQGVVGSVSVSAPVGSFSTSVATGQLQNGNNNATLNIGNRTFNIAGSEITINPGTVTNSTGQYNVISSSQTINQSGSATAIDYYINDTETGLGSGGHKFVSYGVSSTEKFSVKNDGTINSAALTASKVVFTDASKNLTSTGIGTGSQLIAGDGSLVTSTLPIHGNSTTTGTATTAVTVTIGSTMANTNYMVNIAPQDLLTAVNWYISAKTTTTFTITFVTALTGSINFDWEVIP